MPLGMGMSKWHVSCLMQVVMVECRLLLNPCSCATLDPISDIYVRDSETHFLKIDISTCIE